MGKIFLAALAMREHMQRMHQGMAAVRGMMHRQADDAAAAPRPQADTE